ncbi:Carbonic anhydrase IX [Aspergillus nanangensis]|uniref:Carbonic anhydrase n=1 Tax=Aspergillus nanangensis TaxID=2582783 RepID=A0AAD4GWH6_ASPNN|nr:Carbonic anhydrase IX [Aspergillus nanangensis]
MKFTIAALSSLCATVLAASGSDYNYNELTGPLNWYSLDPKNNAACAHSKFQSPINIDTHHISHVPAGALSIDIPDTNGTLFKNKGTTLEVDLPYGTLTAGNSSYTLAQFHFHTPSEHRVNSQYFPLEVHFVFQTPAGSTAVVGFLFELSESNECFSPFQSLFRHVPQIAQPGSSTTTGPLDFDALANFLESHAVYQYLGSLTTPPCTEGVKWFVSEGYLPLDVRSYNLLKKVIKFNARYTQNHPGGENLLMHESQAMAQ